MPQTNPVLLYASKPPKFRLMRSARAREKMVDQLRHLDLTAPPLTEVNEFLDRVKTGDSVRPWAVFKDAHFLSIQASATAFCSPRSDAGPYSHVEIGFASFAYPAELARFVTPSGPEVLAYVPTDLLTSAVIIPHGGIVGVLSTRIEEDGWLRIFYSRF